MDKAKVITQTRALIEDAEQLIERLGGKQQTGGTNLPGDEIDQAVRVLMHKEKITSYSEALELVLADAPQLAKRYADAGPFAGDDDSDRQSAGEALHRAVLEMIRTDATLNYESALSRVLAARPDLAEAYGRTRQAAGA